LLGRIVWLFTTKEVKEVYRGLVEAVEENVEKYVTYVKPKRYSEITLHEVLICPKAEFVIKNYVIIYVTLPYGELVLVYWRGRLIKHYYRVYKYSPYVEVTGDLP